jgi:hypothetical protein
MAETVWRKSSYSDNGKCVELAALADGLIGVRDSKNPEGPVLTFTRSEVAAWLAGTKTGQFDDLA